MANFRDIIGEKHIKQHLQSAIAQNSTSHAYIFSGETGSGRFTFACAFAKTLLCTDRTDGPDACGVCKSCIQAESQNHPDIRYITHEKQSISVDDIREQINNDIAIKPYSSDYKIYIIPDANKMTGQAQNALLKTLEEPPAYAVILLLTDNVSSLLPTIVSRCITLDIKPLSHSEIVGYLKSNLQMEPDFAETAAGFCQGNVGKAIRFASSDDFQEMKEEVLSLLRRIDTLSISDVIDKIRDFSAKKELFFDYLDLMLLWYRDVLIFKVTKDANLLLYQQEYNSISKLASTKSYEDLENIIAAIDKAKLRLEANVNFDIAIELMVLRMKD